MIHGKFAAKMQLQTDRKTIARDRVAIKAKRTGEKCIHRSDKSDELTGKHIRRKVVFNVPESILYLFFDLIHVSEHPVNRIINRAVIVYKLPDRIDGLSA